MTPGSIPPSPSALSGERDQSPGKEDDSTWPFRAGDPEIANLMRWADAVVDVRAPVEFVKGAITSTTGLPLFSDGERAEIGSLYKLIGRQGAIGKGLDLLGPRLSHFIAGFEPFRDSNLLVYCARGGMRSSAVVGLLEALGFRVRQLPGGYKAYRNHILSVFEQGLPPRMIVIHGQTGVGKTELLKRLDNALDLEDCAQHRSSLFGAVNLHPRTQQHFEAHLYAALENLDHERPVFVEGESRKIGTVLMPDSLRRAMEESLCVLATVRLEIRIDRIVAEYGGEDASTRSQLVAALHALTQTLGKGKVSELSALVEAGDLRPVVRVLLDEYYDSRYAHAMRNYSYALTVDATDLDAAAITLAEFAGAVRPEEWPRDPQVPPATPQARNG